MVFFKDAARPTSTLARAYPCCLVNLTQRLDVAQPYIAVPPVGGSGDVVARRCRGRCRQ